MLKELYAYHGAYFDSHAIKTSYNTCYHFWDVTINRGVLHKPGYGHGSVDCQQKRWKEYIETVYNLHNLRSESKTTAWTWEPISENVFTENQSTCNDNVVFCPSVRFFLDVKL